MADRRRFQFRRAGGRDDGQARPAQQSAWHKLVHTLHKGELDASKRLSAKALQDATDQLLRMHVPAPHVSADVRCTRGLGAARGPTDAPRRPIATSPRPRSRGQDASTMIGALSKAAPPTDELLVSKVSAVITKLCIAYHVRTSPCIGAPRVWLTLELPAAPAPVGARRRTGPVVRLLGVGVRSALHVGAGRDPRARVHPARQRGEVRRGG